MARAQRMVLMILLMAGAVAAPGAVWAQLCSGCKAGLAASPEAQRMAGAFNASILFLLGTPYLVAGAVALLIYDAYRRQRTAPPQGEEPPRSHD